ncbi:MAG TPA: rhomboid family intramembrane serine protease [Conexibacter sp.]|nr:rhomboid family intramembrane serine protease [Conexibacter sp.]
MIPVKDDIPTERVPLVTLLLIAADLLACVFLVHGETLRLLADAPFLWWFGVSVEDATSRPRYALLLLLGAAAGVGVQAALDSGAALAPAGAGGATAAAIAAHLTLHRRARIVSLVVVPLLFQLVRLPTWVLAAAWLALQLAFALTLDGGWPGFAAQAAGFAIGLLAIRVLARGRTPQRPASDALAAVR